jgi:hypothetical protein
VDLLNKVARLERRIEELEGALEGIRDHDAPVVAYDQFAYERMVESYREVARAALLGEGE